MSDVEATGARGERRGARRSAAQLRGVRLASRPGDRLDARHPGRAAADPAGGPGVRRAARAAADRARPARDRLVDVAPLPGHPRLDPRPRAGARDAGHRHGPDDRALRRRPLRAGGGAALPDRVHGVGVLGGVAPTRGADAATGGAVQLAVQLAPLLSVAPGAAVGGAHPGHPARAAAGRAGARPVRGGAAGGGQEPAVAARSSRRCSSTTCSTGAGSRPRRRSTT